MSGTTDSDDGPDRWDGLRSWIDRGILAAARGLAFGGLMLAGVVLLLALVAPLALVGFGIGLPLNPPTWLMTPHIIPVLVLLLAGIGSLSLLTPVTIRGLRWLASITRRLCGEWCGVPIARPYLPLPEGAGGRLSFSRRSWWLLTDPATLRDLLWTAVNACGGWVLAVAPAGLVLYGLLGMAAEASGTRSAGLSVPKEIAAIALGLCVAPWLLRCYGLMARSMLAPTGQAELALRVRHLAQTRSETIDTGAAEMRRIERDLHDGAQARLVAMGMTLDAAGAVMEENPAAARALLLEARDASARALAELRDLVRGIHPPVLADRGLADAVRALALDSPLRVQLAGELAGRPPAPVESAAYFAVSELLANVSKHAPRPAGVDRYPSCGRDAADRGHR